eukprot:254606-Chlamydomonas_euryale.AAC.1
MHGRACIISRSCACAQSMRVKRLCQTGWWMHGWMDVCEQHVAGRTAIEVPSRHYAVTTAQAGARGIVTSRMFHMRDRTRCHACQVVHVTHA